MILKNKTFEAYGAGWRDSVFGICDCSNDDEIELVYWYMRGQEDQRFDAEPEWWEYYCPDAIDLDEASQLKNILTRATLDRNSGKKLSALDLDAERDAFLRLRAMGEKLEGVM